MRSPTARTALTCVPSRRRSRVIGSDAPTTRRLRLRRSAMSWARSSTRRRAAPTACACTPTSSPCAPDMPAKRVIPCLDVTEGRVVKGVRFVDLRDAGDPAELAAAYDREGADEIIFLDITASSDARSILLESVERTADQVFIPLAVGGGVRSVDDMAELLTHGADKVSVNTAALADPHLMTRCAEVFGTQCVVLRSEEHTSEL